MISSLPCCCKRPQFRSEVAKRRRDRSEKCGLRREQWRVGSGEAAGTEFGRCRSHTQGGSQRQVSDLRWGGRGGVVTRKQGSSSERDRQSVPKSGETFSMILHFPLKKKWRERSAESALPLPLSCPIEERSARSTEPPVTRRFPPPTLKCFDFLLVVCFDGVIHPSGHDHNSSFRNRLFV